MYSGIPSRRNFLTLQATDATYTPTTRDDTCLASEQMGPENHRGLTRSRTLQSSLRNVS